VTGPWTPELRLSDSNGRCVLSLVGVTYGTGATLQEAGNDLLVRLFDLTAAMRRGGLPVTGSTGRPDPRVLGFLWEVGDLAARGGDLRERVLGIPRQRPAPP
jgi:hypothetical protein